MDSGTTWGYDTTRFPRTAKIIVAAVEKSVSDNGLRWTVHAQILSMQLASYAALLKML